MRLKDALSADLSTFINIDEFADPCIFNLGDEDVQINALVDSNVVNDFEGAQLRGVFVSTIVVYVKQGELTPLPKINSVLKLNGQTYFCRDVRVEQGMDVLTLEKKKS